MLLSEVLILLQFLQWATGHQYCSIDDVQVDCQPCGDTCEMGNATCFRCPRQCGNEMQADKCKSVCSETCKNGICDYFNGKHNCSEGCRSGFAGIFCQEYCPQSCKSGSCDQFSMNCTSCRDGDNAENCVQYPVTADVTTYNRTLEDGPDPPNKDDEGQTYTWTVFGIPVVVAAIVLALLCIAGLAFKAGVKFGPKERGSPCDIELRDQQCIPIREDVARESRTHSYVTFPDMHVDHQPYPILAERSGNNHGILYENLNRSRRKNNTDKTEINKL